jgi:hypothetical protein
MIAEGLANGTTSPPTREHIVAWVQTAMNNLPAQMIRNAWRHGQYSWFLPVAVLNIEESSEDKDSVAGSADYSTRHNKCDRFTALCLNF